MPSLLNTVTINLECPDGTPEGNAPAVDCRTLSIRTLREYEAKLAEAEAATSDDAALAAYVAALDMARPEWRNIARTEAGPDGQPVSVELKTTAEVAGSMTPTSLWMLCRSLPAAIQAEEWKHLCENPIIPNLRRPKSAPAAKA